MLSGSAAPNKGAGHANGRHFSINRGPVRIRFGAGASQDILSEIEALGLEKVLLVCSPGRSADGAAFAARLGARTAGVLAIAREHVPSSVVAEGKQEVERSGADAGHPADQLVP